MAKIPNFSKTQLRYGAHKVLGVLRESTKSIKISPISPIDNGAGCNRTSCAVLLTFLLVASLRKSVASAERTFVEGTPS